MRNLQPRQRASSAAWNYVCHGFTLLKLCWSLHNVTNSDYDVLFESFGSRGERVPGDKLPASRHSKRPCRMRLERWLFQPCHVMFLFSCTLFWLYKSTLIWLAAKATLAWPKESLNCIHTDPFDRNSKRPCRVYGRSPANPPRRPGRAKKPTEMECWGPSARV